MSGAELRLSGSVRDGRFVYGDVPFWPSARLNPLPSFIMLNDSEVRCGSSFIAHVVTAVCYERSSPKCLLHFSY